MKVLRHMLTNAADCADASVLVRKGATKLCMVLMQRLHASQGVKTSGGGGGGGGAGLAWHVLKSSQPSTPPMQRQTEAVTSLLQSWLVGQSESRMQVVALGAPAATVADSTRHSQRGSVLQAGPAASC